jgi:hypothetical protein
MNDSWEVKGVTDSLMPASFSVNLVHVPDDIDAEVSVARARPGRRSHPPAILLLEDVYRGRADGCTVSDLP